MSALPLEAVHGVAGRAADAAPLAPGSWLGVLGGGQLGRMFVHAAQAHGYRVQVLEPDAASPAAAAADAHLQAAYDDPVALDSLAQRCAAVTTEFENVPAGSLERLASTLPVRPGAAPVRVCQHRAREKAALVAAGVPTAPYAVIGEAGAAELGEDGATAAALCPGILKTATLGYDGKGQLRVERPADLDAAWQALGRVPCVLERRLPLALEFSVIVARGADGSCVHLPPQQNLHRDGVLAVTQVPAPGLAAALADQAVGHARRLAQTLDHVGVLCVEFFVLEDGRLVANEMAPRPHNSGHWSIDGCDVSQFALQLRTLAGLPLTAPRAHSAAVMLNLLGDLWQHPDGRPREPDWPSVMALPGAHLHLYGKAQPRPGRKMGHVTFTAASAADARAAALQAAALLGLPGF